MIASEFFVWLAGYFPHLEHDLKMARIEKTPAEHLRQAFFSSLIFCAGVWLFLFVISYSFGWPLWFANLLGLVLFVFIFFLFLGGPQYQAYKSNKYIDGEIVSAIRFLSSEVKTQGNLFSAIVNTSKNFALIGTYFDEIIDKVNLGLTLEQAIIEAIEICPSTHMKNVYWQILNSLQTGSDVSSSLSTLLRDIVEDQNIRIQEYGRELNAFSLFYMMIAIIIPTVGFTILTAILTFLGFVISTGMLITLWGALTLLQYFFLKMTTSRRPAVEAY